MFQRILQVSMTAANEAVSFPDEVAARDAIAVGVLAVMMLA